MCKPAARVGDTQVCPMPKHIGGPILEGSPNVFIDQRAAARVNDPALCAGIPTKAKISDGSSAVLINGKRAARLSDPTDHGGKIVMGSSGVMIGDTGDISVSPEVAGQIFVDGKILMACGCPPETQTETMTTAKATGRAFCEVCECFTGDSSGQAENRSAATAEYAPVDP